MLRVHRVVRAPLTPPGVWRPGALSQGLTAVPRPLFRTCGAVVLFRPLSFVPFFKKKIRALEIIANNRPFDPIAQAVYLKELNKTDPLGVVTRYQSRSYATNEDVVREYVAALIKRGYLNRLSHAQLLDHIRNTSMPNSAGARANQQLLQTAIDAVAHVKLEQPRSATMALFRLVRVLGIVFLAISGGISLVGEENKASFVQNTSVHKEFHPTASSKKFADVCAMHESKEELQELVQFLKDPNKYTQFGGKLPKGYLLVGPPGTGKTLLAKAVAGEAGVPFLFTSGSDFDEMFVGLGAKRIRSLFAAAKKQAPCIIFIDEIDAVGAKRSQFDQSYARMSLNQLLVEMDGFNQSEGVVVIAATNFPALLDSALVRPGRFDKTVTIDVPDVAGREEILQHYTTKVPLASDVSIAAVARACPGMTGADLENIVNTAAIRAAGERRDQVTADDFNFAHDKVTMGPERRSMTIPPNVSKLTAYHEGGHALMALLTPGARAIRKATILPRGPALGMVSFLENEDQSSMSKRQMMAHIDVAMGGRAAEEVIFGREAVTSGASSDLRGATNTARMMVMRFGMAENVGLSTVTTPEAHHQLSPEQRDQIDAEVKKILEQSIGRARDKLKQHEPKLHALAAALLEKESLTAAEISKVVGL